MDKADKAEYNPDTKDLIILYDYWISRRNYMRDCRWVAKNRTRSHDRFIEFDGMYKTFDKRVRLIRKAMKQKRNKGR
jgi:hypothetical protein